MRPSALAILGLGSVLLIAPRTGAALTLEDCQMWLDQLQGEVSEVQVGGPEGTDEHDALLKDLKHASGRKGASPSDSIKDVTGFKKRAAGLAAQGRIPEIEGKRLDNLSETVRRCFEQVDRAE